MSDVLRELREFISHSIREGFESAHEIIENTRDWTCERYGRDDLLPEIKRLTAELFAAHIAEQSDWGPTTDCDRLDEAFAALNRRGIVARHNFSCCNNCGFTEIWDEVEMEEKRRLVDGYVFYHLQCTEHAMKSGQLLLAYGCVEDDADALHRVVNAVVSELQHVGLNATWGGTDAHPIVVEGMVWRRRRSADAVE